jgi:hypothetical protein
VHREKIVLLPSLFAEERRITVFSKYSYNDNTLKVMRKEKHKIWLPGICFMNDDLRKKLWCESQKDKKSKKKDEEEEYVTCDQVQIN